MGVAKVGGHPGVRGVVHGSALLAPRIGAAFNEGSELLPAVGAFIVVDDDRVLVAGGELHAGRHWSCDDLHRSSLAGRTKENLGGVTHTDTVANTAEAAVATGCKTGGLGEGNTRVLRGWAVWGAEIGAAICSATHLISAVADSDERLR